MIAYIPQESFLFQDSIIGIKVAMVLKMLKIVVKGKALSLVKLDKFIKKLPDSNTKIGLLGQTLSGGQRQRLILARAILKKRSFVLDEATSEVDEKSDRLNQRV